MQIPDFIRDRVISFLVSKAGSALAAAISAGVAMGVTKLATLVPGVEAQIDQAKVAAVLWGVCMAALNSATNHWLTKDAKTIQAALNRTGSNLEIDGWIGDKTVQALIRETGLPVARAVPVQTSGISPLILLALLPAVFFGCATDTGDASKDARGRATNQALIEAGKVLGKIAAASLMNAAQQEMRGDTIDFASAASAGLWSNAGTIIDSNAIGNVISAYSAAKLPATADAAADAFARSPAAPAAKTAAIATVISAAEMHARISDAKALQPPDDGDPVLRIRGYEYYHTVP